MPHTRPLAKRACQWATVEHFTRLPQLVFDQHGVSLSHHEILDLVIHQAYFAAAQGILDWYYASEHVWDTARVLHPDQDSAAAGGFSLSRGPSRQFHLLQSARHCRFWATSTD